MTSKQFHVAVFGATGAVGEALLDILLTHHFPIEKLYLLASARSAGDVVDVGRHAYEVLDAALFDFSQVDIALFAVGNAVAAEYAPKAAAAGCIVIDNSSHFRYDPDVPLVVPEVNAHALADFRARNIIANPNCSTIQLVVALKPIYDAVGITRINVATYQAVSGSGKAGINELVKQTSQLLNAQSITPKTYPVQIAFNVLPHIDVFEDNGYTREEMKIVRETRKILGDDAIEINPTAVRVPVFFGHSEAVHLETRDKITAEQARQLLRQAPGVIVLDDPEIGSYPTPVLQGTGEDAVYVGRIREDISHSCGLNLWVVADNVRKGAALNAVQIAQCLISDYL